MSESFALAGTPGSAGGFYTAPVGTAAPTDAGAALNAAFTGPIMVGPDGVTLTLERNTTNWTKWGGNTIRKVTTDGSVKYTVPVIDSSFESLQFVFGPANVSRLASGSIHVKRTLTDPPIRSLSFDMVDGDVDIREYVPRAQPTLNGDIVFNSNDPITYELELEALDPGDGVLSHYWATDDVA